MRMSVGVPLVAAAAAVLGWCPTASAGHCGCTAYPASCAAVCESQQGFAACNQALRPSYPAACDTGCGGGFRTCYQTVTETVMKPVCRTCYREEERTTYK